MKIIYFGFSNYNGSKHSGASSAGVALSDFTYHILSKNFKTKYFVCLNSKNNLLKFKKKILFDLSGTIFNKINTIYSFCKYIKKKKIYPKIIIYHSLVFVPLILFLIFFNIHYILQINELYYNVSKKRIYLVILEKILIRYANGFILSTKLLKNYISKNYNLSKKSIPILPGPLFINLNNSHKKKKSKIRMIYTGIIDKKKKGAFIALKMAQLLNKKEYSLDIFGFGLSEDIEILRREISYNNKISLTKVRYLGNKDYHKILNLLKFYDIGLATQSNNDFSNTSFPSKIFFYLSRGLKVYAQSTKTIEIWDKKFLINIYKKKDLSDLLKMIENYKFLKNNEYYKKQIYNIYNNIKKDLVNYLK